MGLFDMFKKNTGEESDEYTGETPPCPRCGTSLTKRYVYSEMYCENCRYGLEDDDFEDEDESLNVYDAAEIWVSNGKDEDYTFGYSIDELEKALKD